MSTEFDNETCYECDSLDITTQFKGKQDGKTWYEYYCRDCGETWRDFEENTGESV